MKGRSQGRREAEARRENRPARAPDSPLRYCAPQKWKQLPLHYPRYNISFHHCHSNEAYDCVASGDIDLALISDDRFSREVETLPLFRESMLRLTARGSKYGQAGHPFALDPADVVRLPWNPEYDLWHEYWFRSTAQPRVFLDQISLMEHFLYLENVWAIAPASVARQLPRQMEMQSRRIDGAPPDRIIYALLKKPNKEQLLSRFFTALHQKLSEMEDIEPLYGQRQS